MLNPDDAIDTQASLRRANLRRALQLVFQHPGAQTRAGIARATGLTAATASSLVAELIDHRLVIEGAQAASTGGKRATTLSIDPDHHLILVIVIRPLDADLTLVALDGTQGDTRRIEYSPLEREDALADAVADVAAQYGDRVLTAGAHLPGTTDGRAVLESVQLGWCRVPLAAQLEKVLSAPVMLVNDVDAEGIAEAAIEQHTSGYRLFIHIGTGVGATVTLDGEQAPGPHDRSGEIGHIQVEFGDAARQCRCGRSGCLEAASSLAAMLGDEFHDAMSDAEILALAATVPAERLREGAVALGRTIKLLAAFMDAAEVVIGGPVRALGDPFLDLVRAEVDYTPSGTSDIPVRYSDPRASIVIGVAQNALTAALGVRWSPEHLRTASAR